MKLIFIIISMLFLSVFSNAQSKPIKTDSIPKVMIDGPMRKGPQPLWLLKHRGKTFSIDTTAMKNGVLASKSIGFIDVIPDKEAVKKYGNAAENGVIVITLGEEPGSKIFRSLKKHLKEVPI
jgi:hypothetical protein